ncbi:hypothetical protein DB30_06084 [Enhygromyxa salina]|uniref:Uncharacterized protein n=1 Tax=Enhygromyxa salina TaxID=215803 RepID=A0A0C2D4P2_9BACT|nr:hypothetical protein DB30_06084 [Enhygromyxa salina]
MGLAIPADLHIDASATTPKWDGRPMMFIADKSRAVDPMLTRS